MQEKTPDLPFGFERAEDSPGFLLWQTTITWQRLIKKAVEKYQISHAQFVILAILLWFEGHNIDPNQVLLANWSKLDKMTVSKSLKKLAELGLVSRKEHSIDTRAKKVALTAKGKILIKKLVPIVEGIDENFFGKLTKQEEKSFIQMLQKLSSTKP